MTTGTNDLPACAEGGCYRDATWHVRYAGEWTPRCRYHVGQYSDLARHRLDAPYHDDRHAGYSR